MLSRLGFRGRPVWALLALIFPAIVASVGALAYYGYRYSDAVSLRMEDAFRENALADATRLAEAVQLRLDARTRAMLQSIELVDEGPRSAICGRDGQPFIDSYAVVHFDARGKLRGVCQGGTVITGWGRFTRSTTEVGPYLRSLDFKSVQPGNFRYLHQRFDQEDVLVAYMRKENPQGRAYFVTARLDAAAVKRIINEELAALDTRRRVVVIDQRRRAVAGHTLPDEATAPRGHRFFFETSFGKSLYAWDVQVAPWDASALQEQAEKQRTLGPTLIVLSASTIAVGLIVVWLGVMAERRASRLKSDFIANVSHELKTPLSLIRMFGEMIATGRHRSNATKDYGAIITRESDRLGHLIDNVLDFSRLERGKASYRFAQGDLGEVVERALDVCRYRIDKENLRLEVAIEPHLPMVRMDENALTLVALNLIDNAIKYGAEGGLVEVTVARRPGQVALRVADRGPGVPREEWPRLFERFYRARSARDKNVRGSGIGLSLVKAIVAAHGGRIEIEGQSATAAGPKNLGFLATGVARGSGGRGIAFCVYLPAPIVPAEGASAEGAVAEGVSAETAHLPPANEPAS